MVQEESATKIVMHHNGRMTALLLAIICLCSLGSVLVVMLGLVNRQRIESLEHWQIADRENMIYLLTVIDDGEWTYQEIDALRNKYQASQLTKHANISDQQNDD